MGCILFELIKLEKFFDYFEEFKLLNENESIFNKMNTLDVFKKLLNM